MCSRLRTDPSRFLGRQHAALAAAVPPKFPDVNIARLLVSPSLLSPDRYANLDTPRAMDLARLGQLCELYFAWGSSVEILKTFRTALWPGEIVRTLINEGLKEEGSTVQVRSSLLVLLWFAEY